jgi:hypothetical protein
MGGIGENGNGQRGLRMPKKQPYRKGAQVIKEYLLFKAAAV